MAKKAKKSAVKKTSSKSKSTIRTKTSSKVSKAKAAKVAVKNKAKASIKVSVTPKTSTAGLRVAEYKLFTEDSVRNLEDQVNYQIQKGWAPVGGVVFSGSTYTQTMVRHDI